MKGCIFLTSEKLGADYKPLKVKMFPKEKSTLRWRLILFKKRIGILVEDLFSCYLKEDRII
ncbi:hypothetical protein AB674_06585 [Flavobacterium sp. ABG]|nr:hypothetical protein AB674_06585 [Flavobacterium sp. ABG]